MDPNVVFSGTVNLPLSRSGGVLQLTTRIDREMEKERGGGGERVRKLLYMYVGLHESVHDTNHHQTVCNCRQDLVRSHQCSTVYTPLVPRVYILKITQSSYMCM